MCETIPGESLICKNCPVLKGQLPELEELYGGTIPPHVLGGLACGQGVKPRHLLSQNAEPAEAIVECADPINVGKHALELRQGTNQTDVEELEEAS